MIDKILIKINNIGNTFNMIILPEYNKCFVNNVEKRINEDKINELLNIIINWKNNYGLKGIDMEEFNIEIISNDGTNKYSGKGIYPNNYHIFKEWVSELYDR